MKYRFDLDSLRGFAMLMVLIYHFNKYLLPRGFIGVDLFFILSGYVNTLSNSKKVSIKTFYTKRIIRLYPTQLICLALVYIKLSIEIHVNYKSEMNNLMSALIGYSNYHFYYVSIDYLQSSSSPSDVIHFWSLSLENQFYLFFPVIMLFFKLEKLFTMIYILFIIICLYESIYYNSYAYFSLSSRLNEFMLGSLLSVPSNTQNDKYNDFITLWLLLLGIIDKKMINFLFPLPYLLLVEPFISLLIINESENSYILKSKTLNFFGRVSYSFYLFHYPIVMIVKDRSSKHLILIFILSIIISSITTYAIEIPFRTSQYQMMLVLLIAVAIISYIIILFQSKLKYKKYVSSLVYKSADKYNETSDSINEASYLNQSPEDVRYEWECNYYYNLCWCPFIINNNIHNEKYIYENILKRNVLFLIGDSHLEQWSYVIYPYAHKQGYTLLELYSNMDYIRAGNYQWLNHILKMFRIRRYAIISNHIHNYELTSINIYIIQLLNMFEIVYIIQDTPQFNYDPNNCLIRNINKKMCYGILGYNATIIKYPIIHNTKLHYIDLDEYICDKNKCPFIYKGYPVYMDNTHLNMNYTLFLRDHFFQKGFILDNVNNISPPLCKTAIWCRRDYGHNNLNCKNKNKF